MSPPPFFFFSISQACHLLCWLSPGPSGSSCVIRSSYSYLSTCIIVKRSTHHCWPVRFSLACWGGGLASTPEPITVVRGMWCSDWLGLSHMLQRGRGINTVQSIWPGRKQICLMKVRRVLTSGIGVKGGIDQERAQDIFQEGWKCSIFLIWE